MSKDHEFTVRFLREGQVERAYPKDSPRGGYWIEKIPAGTVKRMSRRSVEFWRGRDRGMIEVIEQPQAAVAPPPSVGLPATAGGGVNVIDWTEERKGELRRAIDAALSGAGSVESVLAWNPELLPNIDPDVIERLGDPFSVLDALRSVRAMVKGRPGRRPRNAP